MILKGNQLSTHLVIVKTLQEQDQICRSLAYSPARTEQNDDIFWKKEHIFEVYKPSEDYESHEQFTKKIDRLVDLVHPCLPKWGEYATDDQSTDPFLSFVYSPGVSLKKIMEKSKRRNRPLPLPHSLSIGLSILDIIGQK